MDIFWGIVLFIGIILAIVFLVKQFGGITESRMQLANHIEKVNLNIASLPMTLDKKFQYEVDKMMGINKLEKFIVLYDYSNEPKYKKYDFKNIIETKIKVDDETIVSSANGSAVGRAIAGGIIAGGAGAIVGGLSGKKIEEQKIKKLELEILFNDLDSPSASIPFFESTIAENASSSVKLQSAQKEINDWLNLLKIIIHQNKTAPAN